MTTQISTAVPPVARRVLAARFATSDGASRAVDLLSQAGPGRVGSTAALLFVRPDGGPTFVQLRGEGGGRCALVGGLVGVVAGPLDILAGSGIKALAHLLVERGLKDTPLRRLGAELTAGESVVVIDTAAEAIPTSLRLLGMLGASALASPGSRSLPGRC